MASQGGDVSPLTSLYAGKLLCAPMVRISNLGFRSFAEAHGADVIFTEEVVAVKLQKCIRTTRYYEEIGKNVVEYIAFEPFKKKWRRTIAFSRYARDETRDTGKEDAIGSGSTDVKVSAGEETDASSPTPVVPPTPSRAALILQLGVSDKEAGAAAALLSCDDVDGFDINMGCPKKFSVDSGMGAALMTDPQRAADIIIHIYDSINAPDLVRARGGRVVPVSMKTRIMPTPEATVKFLLDIISRVNCVSTSEPSEQEAPTPVQRIHAITLHARTRGQTSDTPPLSDVASAAVQLARKEHSSVFKNICFVFNGSVHNRADGLAQMTELGFDSAMIARDAMWNPTVFTREAPEPLFTSASSTMERQMEVYGALMESYARHRTPFLFAKYHLTRSFPFFPASKHLMPRLQSVKNYSQLARIFKSTPEVAESFGNQTWEEYATEEEIERWHLGNPCTVPVRTAEEVNRSPTSAEMPPVKSAKTE